jgi:hypothetical protein
MLIVHYHIPCVSVVADLRIRVCSARNIPPHPSIPRPSIHADPIDPPAIAVTVFTATN